MGRSGRVALLALERCRSLLHGACCCLTRPAPAVAFHLLPAPQLILADESMALDVGSIVVGGALLAGGPTCRLNSRLTFTFHPVAGIPSFYRVRWRWCCGGWWRVALPILPRCSAQPRIDWYGSADLHCVLYSAFCPAPQSIYVLSGGQLDLHGKLFAPTWTRLAKVRPATQCSAVGSPAPSPLLPPAAVHADASGGCSPDHAPAPPPHLQTATAGSSSIRLQDSVGSWEAGQQVAVTTTIWQDETVRAAFEG